MLKCEISDELMERVKIFEGKLADHEHLNYEFKWENCEMLWKEKDTCYNLGQFEIKSQDVIISMKIFEDGHLYLEAAGEKNGWTIGKEEGDKLFKILDFCDHCYFAVPGIEKRNIQDPCQKENYFNMSYCTARMKDDFCDASDFAFIAEETMMAFFDDVTTIHTEFFK